MTAVVDRYDIIKPKVLFTIDSYRYGRKEHELSSRAREVVKRVSQQGKLTNVVVFGQLAADRQPTPDSLKGYVDSVKVSSFSDFIATGANAPATIDFWRGPFNHPIWIVFSSGTTGKPKSIYGPGGGILLMRKVVINLHLNLDHRDAYLQFATMGWIVWNMHVLFAAVGGTVVAYDGSPFHPQSVLWRLIEKYRVTQLGASPRYIQTLAKNKFRPREGRDLSCLKQLYTTGAPVTNDVYEFCEREVSLPCLLRLTHSHPPSSTRSSSTTQQAGPRSAVPRSSRRTSCPPTKASCRRPCWACPSSRRTRTAARR